MTYVTDSMRSALAEHKLRQVCNSGGVRVFRMGTVAMGMDLVFLPDRIGITGVTLGDVDRGLWSDSKRGLGWFASALSERHLCAAFYRPIWIPAVAKAEWEEATRGLVEECDEAPSDWQRDRLAKASDVASFAFDAHDAQALSDIWIHCFGDYPADGWGYDYEPSDAGWLCAIQQRFAELYREREARIAAIVAGWEWDQCTEPPEVTTCYLMAADAAAVASAHADGSWYSLRPDGGLELTGTAGSLDAAKLAARAAVLRQAMEHPGLWQCGEVDE